MNRRPPPRTSGLFSTAGSVLEYRQGPLRRAFARHWPGWRYAGFLTSIFLLLVATATAGALTPSSLVRSGSAAVADDALVPPTLGGNTSPADPLATWKGDVDPELRLPCDRVASNYQSCLGVSGISTTPYRSPDSAHQQSRYLLLDPRTTDRLDGQCWSRRLVVRDRTELAGRSWTLTRHGSWGRQVNFHNVAGDVGSGCGERRLCSRARLGSRTLRRRSSRSNTTTGASRTTCRRHRAACSRRTLSTSSPAALTGRPCAPAHSPSGAEPVELAGHRSLQHQHTPARRRRHPKMDAAMGG